MSRIREVFAVAVILIVPAMSAALAGDNDAGSGQDAGDAPSAALLLAGAGGYQGGLTPADADRDWYALDAPAGKGSCAYARATPATPANLAVTFTTDRSVEVALDIRGSDTRSIALATRGAQDWFYGVEALPATTEDTGSYGFEARAYAWSDLPAEASDAGATTASAAARPAACFTGSVAPASGDNADYYAFTAVAGQVVALSLAAREGSPLLAALIGPDGNGRGYVLPGGASTFSLDLDGTWYAVVEASTSTTVSSLRPTSPYNGISGDLLDLAPLDTGTTASGDEDYLLGTSLDSDDPPNTTTCSPTCTE